jgi:hypothetical protein
MHPISLHPIILWINTHLRSHIIEFHILLADRPTVPDRFNALLEAVGGDGTRGYGGRGDEEDAGLWDKGCEHGSADYGLHGGDGGVGIALRLLAGFDPQGERSKYHLSV